MGIPQYAYLVVKTLNPKTKSLCNSGLELKLQSSGFRDTGGFVLRGFQYVGY